MAAASNDERPSRVAKVARTVRATALKQCLPIGLVLAIVFGLAVPIAGMTVASATVAGRGAVQTVCVWIIFLISGATLKTDDVTKALTAWRAISFGVISILFITPLLAPAVGALPLPLPREFSIGFVLFCSMPTTINSGVALVVQAKGSFALALMLTVVTNLLAVFTVPFYLGLVLQLGSVRISAVGLLLRLLVLILAPLLLGKGARELVPQVQTFVKAWKQQLSLLSNFCLVIIPWMKLSQSRDDLVAAGGAAAALVILLGLLVHCVYLAWNYAMARLLRLPADEGRAVVIMGSQKTVRAHAPCPFACSNTCCAACRAYRLAAQSPVRYERHLPHPPPTFPLYLDDGRRAAAHGHGRPRRAAALDRLGRPDRSPSNHLAPDANICGRVASHALGPHRAACVAV